MYMKIPVVNIVARCTKAMALHVVACCLVPDPWPLLARPLL